MMGLLRSVVAHAGMSPLGLCCLEELDNAGGSGFDSSTDRKRRTPSSFVRVRPPQFDTEGELALLASTVESNLTEHAVRSHATERSERQQAVFQRQADARQRRDHRDFRVPGFDGRLSVAPQSALSLSVAELIVLIAADDDTP